MFSISPDKLETTANHDEALALAFEISKRLAHNGYPPDTPAFVVTWGQIAEAVAKTVREFNLPSDRLTEETVIRLAGRLQQDLAGTDVTGWQEILLDRLLSDPTIHLAWVDPGKEPDEGPLTEAYENATRLGDDEAYWVDCGASAGLFDEL